MAAGVTDQSPDGLAGEAARCAGEGYDAVKLVPFRGPGSPGLDGPDGRRRLRTGVDRVEAVRGAVGPDADVLIECAGGLDVHGAGGRAPLSSRSTAAGWKRPCRGRSRPARPPARPGATAPRLGRGAPRAPRLPRSDRGPGGGRRPAGREVDRGHRRGEEDHRLGRGLRSGRRPAQQLGTGRHPRERPPRGHPAEPRESWRPPSAARTGSGPAAGHRRRPAGQHLHQRLGERPGLGIEFDEDVARRHARDF